jgi:anti-sigma-K factor RskA
MSGADEELDLLAAEYVLRTLEPSAARALAARAEAEPAVRAAIAAWEERLAPLSRVGGPVTPPPDLWHRIAASAGLQKQVQHVGRVARTWRSVAVWRFATGVGFALAAAFAAVAWLGGEPGRPVAALVPKGSAAAVYVAEVRPDGRLRLVALRPVTVEPGKDLELWALPGGATRPIALGVLPTVEHNVALPKAPKVGTQLMISLEPAGGSPTGLPTGPVLFAGTLGG